MIWLGWLALAMPAFAADDDARARELFTTGRELYETGRYEEAITVWSESYDLSNKPLLLLNLANAYERAGQFENALEALTGYEPDAAPDEADEIAARITSLRTRAEVERKEREALEAEKRAREAELEAERRRAEELERRMAEKGSPPPILPIAVTGVGVGLLATGTVSGLRASSARSTLKDPAVCGPSGLCTSEGEAAAKAQRNAALLADVTLATGLVATAVGGVLFVRHVGRARKKGGDGAALWASPTAGGAHLGVSGAF
jgi:tetratricopeptide (TPR) repeat protein